MRRIKNTLRWTVVLGMVVGLLASMLPTAGPVSAGTRAWSAVSLPSATSKRIVDADITDIVVSPNFANDSTIFAIVDGDADGAADDVGISTNAGRSWTIKDPDTTTAQALWELVDIAVSNQYATDTTVVIANAVRVYRSTNSGTSWGQLGAAPGNTNVAAENDASATDLAITSVAIAPNYNGTGNIAISLMDDDDTDEDIPAAASSIQVWGKSNTLNWQVPTTGAGLARDMMDVQFSPSYGADATMLAIGSRTASGAVDTNVHTLVGATNAWDATGGPTPVCDCLSFDISADLASELQHADLTLPSDYDSSVTTRRKFFVGVVDDDNLGTIYRGTTMSTTASVALIAAGAGNDVASAHFTGTHVDGGTLHIGLMTNVVKRSTTMFATTGFTFTSNSTPPVPGLALANTLTAAAFVARTIVAASPDFASDSTVFAGNSGDVDAVGILVGGTGVDGTTANQQSGFSRSTNSGANFHQMSLIDAAGSNTAAANKITDIAVSGANIFLVKVDSGALTDSLWRSTNSGTNWERIDTRDLSGAVELGLLAISPDYTTDSLLYWADGSVAAGSIRRTTNGGNSFVTTSAPGLGAATITAIEALDTNALLVGASDATIKLSGNRGFIWATKTATGIATRVSSIARSPNYAADSTVVLGDASQAVFKSTNGGSTWARMGSVNFFTAGADITVGFDTNYATNSAVYAASGTAADGIRRFDSASTTSWTSINTLAGSVYGSSATATGYANKSMVSGGDGTLYAGLAAGGPGVMRSIDSTARSTARVQFAASPTFTAMANTGSSTALAAGSRFSNVQWASDSGDKLYAIDAGEALTANAVADAVRVFTDTWSNPQVAASITAPTGDTSVGTVAAGAANVTVGSITFTWPTVTGARNYQTNVSTSAAFSTTIAAETQITSSGTVTNASALAANVRYYWRVRAFLDPGARTAATADAWSQWSDGTSSFIAGAGATGVAIPALTSPVLGVTGYVDPGSQPTFVWTAVTSATNYEIQVSTDGTFTDASATIIDKTGASRLGNQLGYQDSATLQPATTYFWRVRAYILSTTVTGAYSPASAFRTAAGTTGAGVAAGTALGTLQTAGNLELVSSFNYTSSAYETYATDPSAPTTALAGNSLATISPNTVIFVTVTVDTTVVVSGVAFAVKANTQTPLPVGASVTITVS